MPVCVCVRAEQQVAGDSASLGDVQHHRVFCCFFLCGLVTAGSRTLAHAATRGRGPAPLRFQRRVATRRRTSGMFCVFASHWTRPKHTNFAPTGVHMRVRQLPPAGPCLFVCGGLADAPCNRCSRPCFAEFAAGGTASSAARWDFFSFRTGMCCRIYGNRFPSRLK